MLDKIDIVMWSYRPNKHILLQCLESIERTIPSQKMCHRIAVIPYWHIMGDQEPYWPFLDYGWEIKYSPRPNIPLQANIALSKVHTDYFASFEQDVIINPEWFARQCKIIESDPKIAVAQGIRLFKGSKVLEAMDRSKYQEKKITPYSLDNNLYRTEAIRKSGGFPTECPIAVDGLLRERLVMNGYKWQTDPGCVSRHIHKSFRKYLQTMIRRVAFQQVYFETYLGDRNILVLFVMAPFAGMQMFRHTRMPQSIIGPLMVRYSKAVAMLVGMRRGIIRGKVSSDVRTQKLR